MLSWRMTPGGANIAISVSGRNRAAATTDGLRNQLTAANRRESAEAARAGRALDENARITAELRNAVGVCSARYTELAAVVDGYRSDLIGLQGYVEAVIE